MTEQKELPVMTKEQLERAALIAESRHIDLATAQEMVYLRDLCAVRSTEDEQVKPDIADWLKPQCQRLRYGRCTTLYCLRRGGYVGKGGPTDYSIATCEPYEIYNALNLLPVQPAASTPTENSVPWHWSEVKGIAACGDEKASVLTAIKENVTCQRCIRWMTAAASTEARKEKLDAKAIPG